MADTRVVLPACPCPTRARLRRLAPSYTFTGCLLPQAYGKGDKARNEDEYRVQASPTMPAKLLMLTQGVGVAQATLTYGRTHSSVQRNKAPLRLLVQDLTSLRESCLLQRWALFRDQLLDLLHELRRPHVFRLFFPAGADVNLVSLGFLVADYQQKRNLLHGMFADFCVHLFVAGIDFDAHPCRPQLRRDFLRVLRMALGNRDHRHLHWREPYRERSGVVLDKDAEKALDRSVEGAVDHHRLLPGTVFGDVFEIEALWQVEVELHG